MIYYFYYYKNFGVFKKPKRNWFDKNSTLFPIKLCFLFQNFVMNQFESVLNFRRIYSRSYDYQLFFNKNLGGHYWVNCPLQIHWAFKFRLIRVSGSHCRIWPWQLHRKHQQSHQRPPVLFSSFHKLRRIRTLFCHQDIEVNVISPFSIYFFMTNSIKIWVWMDISIKKKSNLNEFERFFYEQSVYEK